MDFNAEWFTTTWARVRNQAGSRYTPQLDIPLPLAGYFEALAQESAIFGKFELLADELRKAASSVQFEKLADLPGYSQANVAELKDHVERTVDDLLRLGDLKDRAPTDLPYSPTLDRAERAIKLAQPAVDHLWDAVRQEEQKPAHEQRTRPLLDQIRNLDGRVREVKEYLGSQICSATNRPALLVLGPAGSGKTHLLCEMTRQRVEKGLPALLFLGQAFQQPFDDPVEVLVRALFPSANPSEFLAALDSHARQKKSRCLLCIDAVNEGHRESWIRAIARLGEIPRQFPGIAVVVSCRMPFEKVMIPDPRALGYLVDYHFGYPPDIQSDAVQKYFKGYNIPLPEVPLLEEEFSNPLFLKLFCEAVANITEKARHRQIKDIASGQRGMTNVLEFFAKQKDKRIRSQLGTPPLLAWRVLKDGVAPAMAAGHTGIIPRTEALGIVDAFQPSGMSSGTLLQALINEDLLAEGITFEDKKPVEAIRFPYQKFSDHLIARHLLATQLDNSSKHSIKRSLQDPAGLGEYFQDHEAALSNLGVIEARCSLSSQQEYKTAERCSISWDGNRIQSDCAKLSFRASIGAKQEASIPRQTDGSVAS